MCKEASRCSCLVPLCLLDLLPSKMYVFGWRQEVWNWNRPRKRYLYPVQSNFLIITSIKENSIYTNVNTNALCIIHHYIAFDLAKLCVSVYILHIYIYINSDSQNIPTPTHLHFYFPLASSGRTFKRWGWG